MMFIKKPLFVLITMGAIMLAACDDSKELAKDAADTTQDAVDEYGGAGDAVEATEEAAENAADAVKETIEK